MLWSTSIAEFSGRAVFALVGGGVELLLLLRLRERVRETTLSPAWWWAVAATVGLATSELAYALAGDPAEAHDAGSLRFIVAALTFCPAMAVLGAKRPQDRAWQFVVLALWGILALPAVENFALRRGQTLEVHGVRTAFLAVLIGLEVLNWLPTRRWLTVILVAAGQTFLYAPFFWWGSFQREAWHSTAALLAFLAATVAACATSRTSQRQAGRQFDLMWRDFRDDYGALWGVRIAERVNAAAAQSESPLRLRWSGFGDESREKRDERGESREEEADGASTLSPAMRNTFENLLRRFVSPRWIAKRGENALH